jgi:hypothetical protein
MRLFERHLLSALCICALSSHVLAAPKRRPAPAKRPAAAAPVQAPTPAPEAAAPPAADNGGAPVRGPTRIDFDDRLIQGQSNKSGSVYLYDRKELKIRSMIKKRDSFREEIVGSLYDS